MGTKQTSLTAYAQLSNHNSNQDELDRQAWADFVAKVRELAQHPDYADLMIMVDSDS